MKLLLWIVWLGALAITLAVACFGAWGVVNELFKASGPSLAEAAPGAILLVGAGWTFVEVVIRAP